MEIWMPICTQALKHQASKMGRGGSGKAGNIMIESGSEHSGDAGAPDQILESLMHWPVRYNLVDAVASPAQSEAQMVCHAQQLPKVHPCHQPEGETGNSADHAFLLHLHV